MEIVDEHGAVHQLNPGKNIVGRDSVCNVVVTNSLRDVSRMHLIIEPLERWNDSFHGSLIPRDISAGWSGSQARRITPPRSISVSNTPVIRFRRKGGRTLLFSVSQSLDRRGLW